MVKPGPQILILDDDKIMAECFSYAFTTNQPYQVQLCSNALEALDAINAKLPDLIILDILLNGPDGFSFLNELITYNDTARIPVIIVSSLDLSHQDLSHYGVTKVLQKDTITPSQLLITAQEILQNA